MQAYSVEIDYDAQYVELDQQARGADGLLHIHERLQGVINAQDTPDAARICWEMINTRHPARWHLEVDHEHIVSLSEQERIAP